LGFPRQAPAEGPREQKRGFLRPAIRAIVEELPGSEWLLRTLLFLYCGAILAFEGSAVAPPPLVLLDTARPSAGRFPDGWELKVKSGQADVSTVQDGQAKVLRFKSVKSSFSLERDVDVDAFKTPYLGWRWKVTQVPKGGDFRHFLTDDQAAQVLVAFDDRRVLSYIWDTTAPQGTMENAVSPPLVHVYAIVCHSGLAEANRWIAESRNVAADYLKAFGKAAPHVKGLRLQINSQHTGSAAESYFADLAFRDKAE
jgi:hypothetical protein